MWECSTDRGPPYPLRRIFKMLQTLHDLVFSSLSSLFLTYTCPTRLVHQSHHIVLFPKVIMTLLAWKSFLCIFHLWFRLWKSSSSHESKFECRLCQEIHLHSALFRNTLFPLNIFHTLKVLRISSSMNCLLMSFISAFLFSYFWCVESGYRFPSLKDHQKNLLIKQS